MKQSQLFSKTQKETGAPDSSSKNYELLVRANFINQEAAGVYSFLPLGWRVIKKIKTIVREEMNRIGGQEIFMPGLHPKENWQITGRWDGFDALFQLKSRHGAQYALGATHEEIIVPLAKKFISSYKDLDRTDVKAQIWPKALYQIQTKFRDEPRAKSGLLRGREFIMKDLYSFHQDPEDLEFYYNKMLKSYQVIFKRLGLESILTEASGGTFSKLSHEFQAECEAGEDIIYYCNSCDIAYNREIVSKEAIVKCRKCNEETAELKTAEIGNIFKLNTKFSKPFNLTYRDKQGQSRLVYIGCYGIGISRLMGVIVEIYNDKHGIIWPKSVSPFTAHLIALQNNNKQVKKLADHVYAKLTGLGIEVLYDDRTDVMPGEKFAEADLIGCPWRLVISERSGDKIEIKKRNSNKVKLVNLTKLIEIL